MDRIIGSYTGEEKGPLFICISGMHGNEPAGAEAVDLVLKMLEVEPITNPGFSFRGRILGVRGNLRACRNRIRYIDCDLNRLWIPSRIGEIRAKSHSERLSEERELLALLSLIRKEIDEYSPERVIVMDLHTTAAYGGIFTLVTDDPESMNIGLELKAPVILKMLKGIRGTSLHYFNNDNFQVPTCSIVFESGQHNEPLSVNRAIAAIVSCLRTIGSVEHDDVENRHDEILAEYAQNLPELSELEYRHEIEEGDDFVMRPGFHNFQAVKKGDWLATDRYGKIYAKKGGLILMPLYQSQGEDGFFIIKPVKFEKIIARSRQNYAR